MLRVHVAQPLAGVCDCLIAALGLSVYQQIATILQLDWQA